MYSALAVFLGSGLGGVLRWLVSLWLNGTHPVGTLVVNVLGCFLLGLFSKLVPGDPQLRLLLTTGLCGGFTTFSTFLTEDFSMLRGGQMLLALAYLVTSLVLGLLACWLAAKL